MKKYATEQLIALGEEINSIIFPDEPADFNAPLIDAIANARHTPVSGRNRLIEQIEEDAWEIKPTDNFSAEAKATLAALGVEVEWREPPPKPVFDRDFQDAHKISDKRILTIRHQLSVILKGEKPEDSHEWSEVREGGVGQLDFGEDFIDELNQLIREWMSEEIDPQQITERFQGGGKTLWFLREYVTGWKEYEEKHKDRQELVQLIDNAATWLAPDSIDGQEEIKGILADPEYHPDKDKTIKQYMAGLEKHVTKQRQVAEKHYPAAFKKKPLCAETKWITGLPIYQKKPGKRFFDLMDLLWKRKWSNRDNKELLEKINYKPGNIPTNTPKKRNPSAVIKRERSYKKESSRWVLVQPGASELAKELGVSDEIIRLDLKKAVNARVLKEIGRPGPRQSTVYSIGYWSWYVDNGIKKPKACAYLKKTLKNQIVRQLTTIRKSKGKDNQEE